MVTVDKYIRKLLFEHDCVIIPEFGGILTHHIGAHYDAVNSVFLPARKRLAFNEVLKIDDGLLNYYVATHEKLPREEAANLVRGYVDSLRQQMLEAGTVSIESIGAFSSNAEGKLVFEPDYSQNYNGEWYGLQELAARQVDRDATVEAEELKTLESDLELMNAGERTEASPKSRNWLNWAAAAVFVGAVTFLSALSTTTDSSSLLSTLNPFESVGDIRFVTYTPVPKPKVKERPTPVLPQPVVPIATEMPTKKLVPVEEVVYVPKRERQTRVKTEEAGKVPSPDKAPVVNTEPAKVQAPVNHFYLIAGSFGRLKNAQDLKSQLIRKGFTESSILESGSGRLIKVSAGAYETMETAMQYKRKVDAVTGADSWVYHRR